MFDKITSRIQKLCYGLNADFVDPVSLCLVLPLLVVSAERQRLGADVAWLFTLVKVKCGRLCRSRWLMYS